MSEFLAIHASFADAEHVNQPVEIKEFGIISMKYIGENISYDCTDTMPEIFRMRAIAGLCSNLVRKAMNQHLASYVFIFNRNAAVIEVIDDVEYQLLQKL